MTETDTYAGLSVTMLCITSAVGFFLMDLSICASLDFPTLQNINGYKSKRQW